MTHTPSLSLPSCFKTPSILQCIEVSFDDALAHRQSLRHFLPVIVGDIHVFPYTFNNTTYSLTDFYVLLLLNLVNTIFPF